MSDQFENRLLHYAPQPPQRVWEFIDKALDEVPASTLSQKLYAFEEVPPADSWDKIELGLGSGRPGRVFRVPQTRNWLRYAAAAVILFAVLLLTWQTGKRVDSAEIAAAAQKNPDSPVTEQRLATPAADTQHEVAAITVNGKAIQTRYSEKQIFKSRLHPQPDLLAAVSLRKFMPRMAYEKQTVATNIPLEKYMVYSDGDGNAMKLPKKLFDFITCVREEVVCQQQMQQLQQRFALTAMTTDFTGVLDIVKNLKENQ
jgi:hypothetical protein